MAARLVFVALLATLSGASATREVQKVTPVEKVTELLENLVKKVQAEGKKEAEQYDKFACFCKEQADEKLYNIEKSTKIEAKLNAKIQQLTDAISALNIKITDLTTEIDDLDDKITAAEAQRKKEHDAYLIDEQDVSDAISACSRAIDALKTSKSNMKGKTDMEAVQKVRAVASLAMTITSAKSLTLSGKEVDMLAALAGQPGEAYQYEYHSNDIISTLESLLKKFTNNKNELDQEEFEINSAFEKKRLGLQNEKKFAEKEKKETEAEAEAKTEEKEKTEEELSQETADKAADQSFLDVITADCQEKARLWDQRSKVRADELTAMDNAIKALKEGVAPNEGANRKLVGLQTGSHPGNTSHKGHWVYVADAPKAPSFLQLRGSRSVSKEQIVATKVQEMLLERARRLKSPYLSAAALKVRVSEDHFVKVRGIIKDLLARLKAEAEDEANEKSFCDKNMAAAISERDTQNSLIEEYTASISSKESEVKKLTEEIADLSAAIAANKKALNEATELREEDKADNEQVITDASAGKLAVEKAIAFLEQGTTWGGASLVQSQYVPPNSDREGNTVGDLAPEVFDSEYKGATESGKGIMGMLDVILSDFDRTIQTVTQEETDAADEFSMFKTNNEADTSTKEGSVKTKEGQIATLKDELTDLQDQKVTATDSLDAALAELETLHKRCVAGEETYEERVEKRNKEIESLKEAHAILEDWQS